MRHRPFWTDRIEHAWRQRSVVWLPGVRRVGKTTLCQGLPEVEYFDCERPRTRRLLDDPEGFLDSVRGRRIVLDEIHRLPYPSELLKVAADHYRDVRVLATGSSVLGASARFRDTLAGRKREVWLTPMALADQAAFGHPSLTHRLLRGGLPPFFLAADFPEADFQEWMDAYWARDIQELFRLERRQSFQCFVELVLAHSGGLFEATRFARACEVSRTTITNYLGVLEATFVAHVIRPFTTRRATEILAAPKVYGFDTGFVVYYRGWQELRREDLGALWEHYVLNELHACLETREIRYWRDKQGHEVDFVLARRASAPVAIECKWSAKDFDPGSLRVFRRRYPRGDTFLVAHDVERRSARTVDDFTVTVIGLRELIQALSAGRDRRHRS
ncbi:MAG: ATP-binding protein [Gemmatimonadetes bacterium]|nr:ATP-binding protein [Gemmatimonadota bacterium]